MSTSFRPPQYAEHYVTCRFVSLGPSIRIAPPESGPAGGSVVHGVVPDYRRGVAEVKSHIVVRRWALTVLSASARRVIPAGRPAPGVLMRQGRPVVEEAKPAAVSRETALTHSRVRSSDASALLPCTELMSCIELERRVVPGVHRQNRSSSCVASRASPGLVAAKRPDPLPSLEDDASLSSAPAASSSRIGRRSTDDPDQISRPSRRCNYRRGSLSGPLVTLFTGSHPGAAPPPMCPAVSPTSWSGRPPVAASAGLR